jgi:flagellum-specific peptidoglycan hydrolase FlgJ
MTKPGWQRATALVSLSTCGAMTGFAVAHDSVAGVTSPAGLPVRLQGLDKPAASGDGALRPAIVSAARHYLQLARTRTPAQMEAMIWRADSTDGADHGQSCAAFASLTLELGARAAGEQSWVTGGGSYPWPLRSWADVRVEPNPASLDVVSVQQDAQAHHRWHPLGDGYRPQPGDWVLFDGHVEVVTGYAGASLETIGGDSLPGFTVNAHTFPAPLAAQGVLGFVNNGDLADVSGAATTATSAGAAAATSGAGPAATESAAARADIPGMVSDIPASAPAGAHPPAYSRHEQDPDDGPGTAAQRAFIALVAPGAIAAEQRYGVPAAVTIAQAIDESGWGRSELATADRNLFGIKGTGPAGSDVRPTQEYENGVWVNQDAPFRVYRTVAESIEDHGRLLATSAAYRQAMASRHQPDAFAQALTGVYATNPDYGPDLIALMRMFDLYRYDAAAAAPSAAASAPVTPAPAAPASGQGEAGAPQQASIPGVAGARALAVRRTRTATAGGQRTGGSPMRTTRYIPRMPPAVAADFVATAKNPLTRARPLYQDVAGRAGIGWELLAACDWMQCRAQPRYSPVYGEKLGTLNPDGTVFRSRSAALAQCVSDLADLAGEVYGIRLTSGSRLSVRELAAVFAAFRWGGLLEAHGVSAMEFPYSVAGLTVQHLKMRWPDVGDPDAPDKPGTRFRTRFGAVPVVLSLGYRATA